MDTLNQTQATLHAMLRGMLPPEAAASQLGVDPARLSIYRNFVRDHVLSVIEKNHPMTLRLLGEAGSRLRADYFLAHPATSWELNQAAAAFADFLEARLEEKDAGVPAFAVALARFEWECFAAYIDAARIPEAAGLDRPVVNPTLRAMHFDFPLVRWALDAGDADTVKALPELPAPLESPEMVFIFRHPTREVSSYYRASDSLLFALKVVLEEIPLEDAARESGQSLEKAQELLAHASEIGVILAPA